MLAGPVVPEKVERQRMAVVLKNADAGVILPASASISPLGPLGTTYLSQRGVCGPWLHYQRPRSQLAEFYQFLR